VFNTFVGLRCNTLDVVIFSISFVAYIYDLIFVRPLLNLSQCNFGLVKTSHTYFYVHNFSEK
jgi:hypothetical protein